MRRLPILRLLPLAGLSACGATNLAQGWQLDRVRILGVRATPAEPRPGERVTFESLVYTPAGTELGGVLWFACLPDSADDFGCELDPSVAELFGEDLESLTPDEQAALYQQAVEAGFVGFEPLLPPSWTAPADALDGLDATAQLEGVSAIVNLTALPEDADAEDADVEVAYKRLPISLAETPNHNPDVVGFEVYANPVFRDGTFVRGTAVSVESGGFTAERGVEYQLVPLFADDAIETYRFTLDDGTVEERTEEPFYTWYTEGGSFLQEFSLHPYSSTTWTAPDAAFEGVVVAVARDRRGGMGWSSLQVTVP
jgi:hypothetical protein